MTLAIAGVTAATATAQFPLPVTLDFNDQPLGEVSRIAGQIEIHVQPDGEKSNFQIVSDEEKSGNQILSMGATGTTTSNRLKFLFDPIEKPFDYEFRCRVEGSTKLPGFRSLLTLYQSPNWSEPAVILLPYWTNNSAHAKVDKKYENLHRALTDWVTFKVSVNIDGDDATEDTYSLSIDGEEVLTNIALDRNFDGPVDTVEMALDFEVPEDGERLRFLIDDIKITPRS